MADANEYNPGDLNSPAGNFAPVTKSDTVDIATRPRALYVGTGGALVLRNAEGQAVVFANVPSGTLLPVRARRVMATGSAADDIVALW